MKSKKYRIWWDWSEGGQVVNKVVPSLEFCPHVWQFYAYSCIVVVIAAMDKLDRAVALSVRKKLKWFCFWYVENPYFCGSHALFKAAVSYLYVEWSLMSTNICPCDSNDEEVDISKTKLL